MDTVVISVLGILGTIVGICGGAYGLYTNKKRNASSDRTEYTQEGRQDGAILTELGYIKSSVDDIKRKQDQQDMRHLELVQKIAGYDEFKSTTERRLDTIEDELHK